MHWYIVEKLQKFIYYFIRSLFLFKVSETLTTTLTDEHHQELIVLTLIVSVILLFVMIISVAVVLLVGYYNVRGVNHCLATTKTEVCNNYD